MSVIQLSTFDLQQVIEVLHQLDWDDKTIRKAIDRYERLLLLAGKYPNEQFVPDKIADEVLHTHFITNNQINCIALSNGYLEHGAGFGTRNLIDRLNWLILFAKTQFLMLLHFGFRDVNLCPAKCVLGLRPRVKTA